MLFLVTYLMTLEFRGKKTLYLSVFFSREVGINLTVAVTLEVQGHTTSLKKQQPGFVRSEHRAATSGSVFLLDCCLCSW